MRETLHTATSEPSKRPWTLVFFQTPLEPWGRYVIRAPEEPGGICITMSGLDILQEANGRFIVNACNVHDELVERLRDAANAMERMDTLLLQITGSPHEAEKGEIERARATIQKATTDNVAVVVAEAAIGGGF